MDKKDYGRKKLPRISNPDIEHINFAKRAILCADAVNAVSEQYKEEIMTRKFGQDLDRILRNRKNRLFGIVNGIDYNAYNPNNDPGVYKNYNFTNNSRKLQNKEYVQKLFNFRVNPNIPLICSTSRVTFQKGFELIFDTLEPLLRLNIQLIVMGDGDKKYISKLKKYQKKHPRKIAWIPFSGNSEKETLLYAASDLFLLPSHHEPCGINQLIAMRYGCIPIVRKVGGLYDTVRNFNPRTGRGNGFSFNRFDSYSLYGAIVRGAENFQHKDSWKRLSTKAMQESNSWEIPAKKYIELYRRVMRFKNGKSCAR